MRLQQRQQLLVPTSPIAHLVNNQTEAAQQAARNAGKAFVDAYIDEVNRQIRIKKQALRVFIYEQTEAAQEGIRAASQDLFAQSIDKANDRLREQEELMNRLNREFEQRQI